MTKCLICNKEDVTDVKINGRPETFFLCEDANCGYHWTEILED